MYVYIYILYIYIYIYKLATYVYRRNCSRLATNMLA